MPELPEVETTVRRIKAGLLGQRIDSVRVCWNRSVFCPKSSEFRRRLTGATFVEASRRGKFIVFVLQPALRKGPPFCLLIHLRMSGRLFLEDVRLKTSRFTRAFFNLNGGKRLSFVDVRKFGKLYLVDDCQEFFTKLGPEPLTRELQAKKFHSMLAAKKGAIKPLLLNQSFIAGIGNIYADESLWRAKIHPRRSACSLSQSESKTLLAAIKQVLRRAIVTGGTDNGDGVVIGNHRPKVYGREDQPCRVCKAKIKKIRLGQRGTHFCPKCQR